MNKFICRILNTSVDVFVLRLAVIVVFLVFGISKWFDFEVEELKPMFASTWLKFLPSLLGDAGASYALGIVEGIIYICLIISFLNPKFGIIGALGVLATSLTTLSLMMQMGFDGFLLKDVLFIGSSLVILKHDLKRIFDC